MNATLTWSLAALLPLLPGAGPERGGADGRTLRVPADHPTIQQAVDAAAPADTVLVSPGTYREHVRLRPGIVLRSAGDDSAGKTGLARAEATVIDGEEKADAGPGVVMAEGSTLDGFTLTRFGKFDQAEYDKHYATRGANQKEGEGEAGRPNAPSAVLVRGVTAIVRNSIVRDNGDVGIDCSGEEGKRNTSWIAVNVVFRNMGGGIGVADGAAPVVQGNRCFNNLRAGIGARRSAGVFQENDCFDNVRSGIGISEGARQVVRKNRCHKNRRSGIGIRNEGTAPLIDDNDCFENGLGGITARADAEPTIRGNRCHGNGAVGIGFEETKSGRATLSHNKVSGRGGVAVGIHSGWKVTLLANELSTEGGMPPAVMVYKGAEADFSENTIRCGGAAAIRTEGVVRATGNTLECLSPRKGGPPSFSVWALPGSDVTLVGNTIRDWRHALVAEKAAVVAAHNRISGTAPVAFSIEAPAAAVTVVGNRFFGDPEPRSVKLGQGTGIVEDNRVEDPGK